MSIIVTTVPKRVCYMQLLLKLPRWLLSVVIVFDSLSAGRYVIEDDNHLLGLFCLWVRGRAYSSTSRHAE